MTETIGALVIGGNLNGLSIARSLGRRGVPVWVTSPPNIKLASFSRYTQRTLPWPNLEDEAQAAYLLEIAERYGLDQWVLFPTSDESAAVLSKFHAVLSSRFRVSTPTWDILRWAYDKRLTYRLAAEQHVDYPSTIYPATEADLTAADLDFPAILKPATHAIMNRFTSDKAWPAANREELLARYREARELIPPELILIQEMVPGGGEAQFSYAALCCDGKPIVSLTARRTRQYPVDFGYSSSFVETLDVPEIVAPSRRLLDLGDARRSCRRGLSLSPLANDHRQVCAGTHRAYRHSLDPHEYGSPGRYSPDFSWSFKSWGILAVSTQPR
jgi:predicted ATP-grasp superfamily ATP-dependent carboligase